MFSTCNTVCASNNKVLTFRSSTANGKVETHYNVIEPYIISKTNIVNNQSATEEMDNDFDVKINKQFFQTKNI